MLNSPEKTEAKGDDKGDGDVTPASAEAAPVSNPGVDEWRKLIAATIDTIRPNLQRDRGDCELIDVQGDKVFVKMTGACVGCSLSSMTLNGVQAKLVEATGRMIRVIPVSGLPRL
jgi:Fe-S cluster biogenesis protein NfuA